MASSSLTHASRRYLKKTSSSMRFSFPRQQVCYLSSNSPSSSLSLQTSSSVSSSFSSLSSSSSSSSKRLYSSSPSNNFSLGKTPPYKEGLHRSNAEELVNKVPVIEISNTHVAVCDGGGGALGHPIEYIQLDTLSNKPAVCKYCGLRYQLAKHSHDHH